MLLTLVDTFAKVCRRSSMRFVCIAREVRHVLQNLHEYCGLYGFERYAACKKISLSSSIKDKVLIGFPIITERRACCINF